MVLDNYENYTHPTSGHINEINFIEISGDKYDSSNVIEKSEF